MTLTTVLMWSIVRSLLLAAIALPMTTLVSRHLVTSESTRSRRVILAAALLPLFVPDLLTGFSYRLTAMKLSESWISTEGLYAVLLLFRILALQVATFVILPASMMNAESLHSWRLLPTRDWSWRRQYLRMLLMGPWRSGAIAFAASGIFAFQEFETAALIQVDQHPVTFTVWLFDAHAVGEPLARSIRFAAGSLIFQASLLAPLLWLAFLGQPRHVAQINHRRTRSTESSAGFAGKAADAVVWLILLLGVSLICGWPLLSNGRLLIGGLASTATQSLITQRVSQILLSLGVAMASSVLALTIAVLLRRSNQRWLIILCVAPGLCGSLVLSLGLVAMFQTAALRTIYDTTIPLLTGQMLLMLPRAVLLDFLLQTSASPESRGSADLLRRASDDRAVTGAGLVWELQYRRYLLAGAMLTHWSLWDVTTASILRPVSFEPIVTRLYNEMHYGRSESLIGITFLTLLVPLFVYGGIVAGRRWIRPLRNQTMQPTV